MEENEKQNRQQLDTEQQGTRVVVEKRSHHTTEKKMQT